MISLRYIWISVAILILVSATVASLGLSGNDNTPINSDEEKSEKNTLTTPNTPYPVVEADPPTTGIYFPLFAPPGPLWDNMLTYRNAHPTLPWIAIVDPHHGPGAQYDVNYAENIKKLQAANVTVLGYVSTLWAAKSPDLVKADIDKYKEWYSVDGIMLDEMISDPGFEGMYSNFADHAESMGMDTVIGNVGTNISPSYAGTVDAISTVEGDRTPPLSWLKGWQQNYDKSNFVYITYSQSWIDKEYVEESTKYVGSLYITDDTMPFPYDNFPTFFDEVLAVLDPRGDNDLRNLSIRTSDLRGENLDGIFATISPPSKSEVEGDKNSPVRFSSPLTYVGTVNSVFVITAASNSTHVFDHWQDGSTDPARKVVLDSSKVLRAYYRTAATHDLKSAIVMDSLTVQGGKLGMWMSIQDDKGVDAGSGFALLIAEGRENTTYSVTANDHQHLAFDHWEDGSTNRTRTIRLSDDGSNNSENDHHHNNTYLTAFYRIEKNPLLVDLTVDSYTLDGTEVRGLWSVVTAFNKNSEEGSTPLTHLATSGHAYTVEAADSGIYTFDHWEDGSTNRTRALIMPDSDITLSAYYTTPVATLNISSADLAGGKLVDRDMNAAVRPMDNNSAPVVLRQTADSPNMTYTGRLGSVYSIQVSDFGDYKFDHWENGSRDRLRNVMLSSDNTTIIAYYDKT